MVAENYIMVLQAANNGRRTFHRPPQDFQNYNRHRRSASQIAELDDLAGKRISGKHEKIDWLCRQIVCYAWLINFESRLQYECAIIVLLFISLYMFYLLRFRLYWATAAAVATGFPEWIKQKKKKKTLQDYFSTVSYWQCG